MSRRAALAAIGPLALLVGGFLASAQEKTPAPGKEPGEPPVKYEAEEEAPKDHAGRRRRDYAVLEAALNDLGSPKNPEYRHRIENVGPGREIVVGDKTYQYGIQVDLDESRDIDNQDHRLIPRQLREDLERRNGGRPRSLADFKPANPNILVIDLDRMFEEAQDPNVQFLKRYPNAWGYVRAFLPGYSADGTSALVVFEGGPHGGHGLAWVYLLARKGKRWEVQWRHCRPRE